ncbi:MAG: hypothetical protein CL675_14195 [Bdellovibrionaceae bacterium]|jgi:hypothetical protein|nr:hypothetical protein [Pseudobdellovibrionaceae bacterium]
MKTINIIIALVIGLLLLSLGFYFIYAKVWKSTEGVDDYISDDVGRAKQQCDVTCGLAKTTAKSCADWQKKYCEREYLDSNCGTVDGVDIAKCEPPVEFLNGDKGSECNCAYAVGA